MTLVENFLQPAIAYLATVMPGVVVSGPRDIPVDDLDGSIPLTVIIQAAGGPNPIQPPMRQVVYTARCYANSSDDSLALYGGLLAALTDALTGEGISNILVEGRWWLYEAQIGGQTGPEPDPEGGWPVVAAPITMVWSMMEV